MKIQIKNRLNGNVIYETDAETLGAAIVAALASGADLRGAVLRGADLRDAVLRGAVLRDADLSGAVLRGADLSGADLLGADLSGAVLRGADLSGADLRGADLSGADLSGADLRGAVLRGAVLRDADLSGAVLRGAVLLGAAMDLVISQRTILPEGDLIGYKKLSDGIICKLKIPADAKRVGGLIGRKCRAEYAIVLEGEGVSQRDGKTKYSPGIIIKPDKFDPSPLVECSHGIHFFITKLEAENY